MLLSVGSYPLDWRVLYGPFWVLKLSIFFSGIGTSPFIGYFWKLMAFENTTFPKHSFSSLPLSSRFLQFFYFLLKFLLTSKSDSIYLSNSSFSSFEHFFITIVEKPLNIADNKLKYSHIFSIYLSLYSFYTIPQKRSLTQPNHQSLFCFLSQHHPFQQESYQNAQV